MKKFIDKTLALITIVSFLLLGYFILNPNYAMARSEYPWLYFLVGAIFFNTTHIFITFISLRYLPEINSLSFLKTKIFILRCVFVFLGSVFVSYFSLTASIRDDLISKLFKIFLFSTTIHHTIMQIYGLSSQVNLKSNLNFFEKHSARFFTLVSVGLYSLIRFMPQLDLKIEYAALCSVWIAISIYVISRLPTNMRLPKANFLGRYLCIFLCFIHPIYTLITMTFHGLEYLSSFLFNKRNSALNSSQDGVIKICLFILVPATAIFFHNSFLLDQFNLRPLNSSFLIFLDSILMGLNLLHFFIDAKIYQFSNSEVREKVSILFHPDHSLLGDSMPTHRSTGT